MNRLATLDAALAHIQSTSSASAADDKMRALRVANDLFGADDESRELLEAAVDVLRTRSLVRVVARPSDRCFVAIDAPAAQGATQRRYACFPDYCSCPPFFEAAKAVETAVLCKHMLAARLACGAPASPCCVHHSARDRSAGPSSARSRRSTSTTASTTRSSPAGPRCDA